MKIINIPSVNSENCNTTFVFHDKKHEIINWIVDVECSTPSFTGKITMGVENDCVKRFIEDLEKVEKERKGECQIYDEWSSFYTIRSVCQVPHLSDSLSQ